MSPIMTYFNVDLSYNTCIYLLTDLLIETNLDTEEMTLEFVSTE